MSFKWDFHPRHWTIKINVFFKIIMKNFLIILNSFVILPTCLKLLYSLDKRTKIFLSSLLSCILSANSIVPTGDFVNCVNKVQFLCSLVLLKAHVHVLHKRKKIIKKKNRQKLKKNYTGSHWLRHTHKKLP